MRFRGENSIIIREDSPAAILVRTVNFSINCSVTFGNNVNLKKTKPF